jgi:hypothetical protein
MIIAIAVMLIMLPSWSGIAIVPDVVFKVRTKYISGICYELRQGTKVFYKGYFVF